MLTWDGESASACLPSGMLVVIRRDPARPLVTVASVVDGGLADAQPGAPQAPHVAEHLWFRTRHGGEEVMERLDAVGGTSNAFTLRDRTEFVATAPADALADLLRLEGLRLTEPMAGLTTVELDAEVAIVANELTWRGVPLAERLESTLLDALLPPELWDKRADELGGLDLASVGAWTASHWLPARTTLAITGDVDLAKVGQLLSGALPDSVRVAPATGPIACVGHARPKLPAPLEARSREIRTIEGNDRRPSVVIYWTLPGAIEQGERAVALDAVELLEAEIRHYVGRGAGDAVETVDCTYSPGAEMSSATCFLGVYSRRKPAEILRLALVAAEEVAGSALSHYVLPLQGLRELNAERLHERLGDLTRWQRALDLASYAHDTGWMNDEGSAFAAINAVGIQELRAFAERWLPPRRAIRVIVEPGRRESVSAVGALSTGAPGAAPMGSAASVPAPSGGAELARRLALPSLSSARETSLSNGMRLLIVPTVGGPRARVGVVFADADAAAADPAVLWLADVGLDRYHTAPFDLFRAPIGLFGRWLSTRHGASQLYALATDAGALEPSFYLLRRQLDSLHFEIANLGVERDVQSALVGQFGSEPEHRAHAAAAGALLGESAARANEDPEWLVRRIAASRFGAGTRAGAEAAQAWMVALHRPEYATVLVVGRIEPELAARAAEDWLGDWKGWPARSGEAMGTLASAPLPALPPVAARTVYLADDPDRPQTRLDVVCRVKGHAAIGEIAATLIQERLTRSLRADRHLTYDVRAGVSEIDSRTRLMGVVTEVETSGAAQALDEILSVIAEVSVGVNDADLAAAKRTWASNTGMAVQEVDGLFSRLTLRAAAVHAGEAGAPVLTEFRGLAERAAAVRAESLARVLIDCAGREQVAVTGPAGALGGSFPGAVPVVAPVAGGGGG